MENQSQPIQPLQPQQPLIQEPAEVPVTPPKSHRSVIVVSVVVGLLLIAGAFVAGLQIGKDQPTNQQLSTMQPTASPSQASPIPTQVPAATMEAQLDSTSSPEQDSDQTAKVYPEGWKEHAFPEVGVLLATPSQWESDFQSFPNIPSNLIRFWQGSTPNTATIQLDIKSNWDNTGDAMYEPRNFRVNSEILAAKIDPPKLEVVKRDRYQTNYYFETDKHVYILTCVHNWIDNQYQLCENMLKTGTFE